MFYEMELSQFAHNWLLRSFRFCFFGDIIVVRQELVLLIYGGYILNNVALHISFLRSCFEKLVALLCTDACFPILIQVGNREGILKKYQIKWTAMKEGITYRSCLFQNLFLYIWGCEI